MPVAVIELLHTQPILPVFTVDCERNHLSWPVVHPQTRVTTPELQQEEVLYLLVHVHLPHWAVICQQTVSWRGDELKAGVTGLTLCQGLIPGPAVTTETVTCLLTAWSVKPSTTVTATHEQKHGAGYVSRLFKMSNTYLQKIYTFSVILKLEIAVAIPFSNDYKCQKVVPNKTLMQRQIISLVENWRPS